MAQCSTCGLPRPSSDFVGRAKSTCIKCTAKKKKQYQNRKESSVLTKENMLIRANQQEQSAEIERLQSVLSMLRATPMVDDEVLNVCAKLQSEPSDLDAFDKLASLTSPIPHLSSSMVELAQPAQSTGHDSIDESNSSKRCKTLSTDQLQSQSQICHRPWQDNARSTVWSHQSFQESDPLSSAFDPDMFDASDILRPAENTSSSGVSTGSGSEMCTNHTWLVGCPDGARPVKGFGDEALEFSTGLLAATKDFLLSQPLHVWVHMLLFLVAYQAYQWPDELEVVRNVNIAAHLDKMFVGFDVVNLVPKLSMIGVGVLCVLVLMPFSHGFSMEGDSAIEQSIRRYSVICYLLVMAFASALPTPLSLESLTAHAAKIVASLTLVMTIIVFLPSHKLIVRLRAVFLFFVIPKFALSPEWFFLWRMSFTAVILNVSLRTHLLEAAWVLVWVFGFSSSGSPGFASLVIGSCALTALKVKWFKWYFMVEDKVESLPLCESSKNEILNTYITKLTQLERIT